MNLLDFQAGIEHPFFLIAGPCVIESEALAIESASYLKKVCGELDINFIYKSSFDKANRTSAESFRGLGIEEGLRILEKVKSEVDVAVLTDVHEDTPLNEVSSVVDVLQTPAFLVRQTNFIQNVCSQGLPVNIKKGQFQAPWDMENVVEKARATGNQQIMICDRGTSFGYNTLVSDMRGLSSMRTTNCPIVLMRPTQFSSPEAKANHLAVKERWFLFWHDQLWQPEFQGFSWKLIQIQIRQRVMAKTLCL